MADYTDDDVARLADYLATAPPGSYRTNARHLLEQGVTLPPPPPDPAVVVAKALHRSLVGSSRASFDPDQWGGHADLVAAVRDLFPTDALEAAAAKVQEAGT